LFKGYGVVSAEQFADQLSSGEIEIWSLVPGAYALITWAETKYGRTLNVLTTAGDESVFATGLQALERVARANGAQAIYSVGHPGWTKYVMVEGYIVQRSIVMIKELT
jgi:hypothetical protein